MEFAGAGGAIHSRCHRYHDECEGDVSYKVNTNRSFLILSFGGHSSVM